MSLLQHFHQNIQSFDSVEHNAKIAVAVSGGVDSIALLVLARNSIGPKQIVALTVNHNLRHEALEEAKHVGSICADFGIEHRILTWNHEKISGNIHDKARNARYKFMTDWCNQNGIKHLLTAHHADDKIENFFIRLSKASGIFGLSSHNSNIINNVTILRPLFDIYKEELKDYLEKQNIKWCEDPSNNDSKYLRSNIRKWIVQMPQDVQKHRILQSIGYLTQAAEYLQADFIKLLKNNTVIYPEGYAVFHIAEQTQLNHLVLSHLLTVISGYSKQPRSESVSKLLNSMILRERSKYTLHGCEVESQGATLTITREFGRKPPKQISMATDVKWDDRWRGSHSASDLCVGHLHKEEYSALKTDRFLEKLLKSIPQKVLFTIPVVRRLEKLIAIPHIAYYNDDNLKHITFSFEPNYVSRLTNFV